ncbi:branched-chain amino acid ABC transporter permease [Halobellus salinus]|uniref:Branched-chain amino acid ABC transporter permease n=1 Tax=Halobellus salinus TaxID=931585 RepID=A0A830E7U4_9EURY|nr:branched-chain amino acid ABC transporter permease [Halobellus salinus]GGJ00304.1 branched-chain amino acid ABC transporter permease [Halobellus salinus]SMP01716.1 amino acid/amide ABC transporter membrane protein 1, HAAT family [Halobellus salinus]
MVSVSTLAAITIDGLAFGASLALLGVGITLVYGLGEVLNLAIGAFAVIAAITASLLTSGGVPLPVAALAGLGVVGVLGLVIDRTLLSLVYRSDGEERILLGIFTTLGLAVMLEGIMVNFVSSRYSLPLDLAPVDIGTTVVTGTSVVSIAVAAVVLAVLFTFLNRTFLGKATRTIFQDERGAQLVGIDPRKIRTLVFVLSAVVAGLAGLVVAARSNIGVGNAFQFTTFALIVSIVGGVRSLVGAVVAGAVLGLVNTLANFFIGSYVATVILFGAAIVFLLFRPEVMSS